MLLQVPKGMAALPCILSLGAWRATARPANPSSGFTSSSGHPRLAWGPSRVRWEQPALTVFQPAPPAQDPLPSCSVHPSTVPGTQWVLTK